MPAKGDRNDGCKGGAGSAGTLARCAGRRRSRARRRATRTRSRSADGHGAPRSCSAWRRQRGGRPSATARSELEHGGGDAAGMHRDRRPVACEGSTCGRSAGRSTATEQRAQWSRLVCAALEAGRVEDVLAALRPARGDLRRSGEGVKHVVGERFKRRGMCWSVAGTHAVLALRAAVFNDRYDDFCAHPTKRILGGLSTMCHQMSHTPRVRAIAFGPRWGENRP